MERCALNWPMIRCPLADKISDQSLISGVSHAPRRLSLTDGCQQIIALSLRLRCDSNGISRMIHACPGIHLAAERYGQVDLSYLLAPAVRKLRDKIFGGHSGDPKPEPAVAPMYNRPERRRPGEAVISR